MRRLVALSLILLSAGCARLAPPAAVRPAGVMAAQAGTIALRGQIKARAALEVAYWDADRDGLVSTEEARAAGLTLDEFIRRDRSDDGGLAPHEWLGADDLLEVLRGLRARAYDVAQAAGPDQQLDRAEWAKRPLAIVATRYVARPDAAIADALFTACDRNADGLIGRDELEAIIGQAYEAGYDLR